MTQEEKRIFLIKAMLSEIPKYGHIDIPATIDGQKQLLRSMMNMRPPIPADPEFLNLQDEYLSQEIRLRDITDSRSLTPTAADGRIYIWQGDITSLKVDAIVNAANSALLGCFQPCHNCIDNIIHSLAGIQLRLRCHELMQTQGHEEPTGSAKITPGFNLPCKFILHTVGPIISGPLSEMDCELLAACYRSCLQLAVKNNLHSVAFCCISTGVFHFPADRAAGIAVATVSDFLRHDNSLNQVIFDVFTDNDLTLYRQLLRD